MIKSLVVVKVAIKIPTNIYRAIILVIRDEKEGRRKSRRETGGTP